MSKHFKQRSRFDSEDIKFTWRIEDFTCLQMSSLSVIRSEIIKCLNTEWFLKLVLDDDIDPLQILVNPSAGYTKDVMVFLDNPSDVSYDKVECTIGFENKFGSPFSVSTLEEQNSEKFFAGVSRAALMSEKDIFLPDDVLTIFCKLKVSKLISGIVTKEEEKPQLDGAVKYLDDLQSALSEVPLSDIVLKFEDGKFHGHKIVLACRSKVFRWKFENMKNGEVSMRLGMKEMAGMDMIRYIYTGKFQVLPLPRIFELFDNAEAYDLPELKQNCRDHILENLSAENICDVAVFANSHNDKDIDAASAVTLSKNFKTVLGSGKWKSFAGSNPALYTKLLERAVLVDLE